VVFLFVEQLVNMEILHLNRNQLSELRADTVARMTTLKFVHVADNQLADLPWYIDHFMSTFGICTV
jgi:hypothetical protein